MAELDYAIFLFPDEWDKYKDFNEVLQDFNTTEIKDVIKVILPKINDFNIRQQVLQKLNSIKYNF